MYQNIEVEKVKEIIEKNGATIIDVRLKEDYNREKIEGALNIFFGDYDFDEQVDEFPKDNKYIIYCQVGVGSLKAIGIMEDLGFKDLYNMSGGLKKWKEMGYEVK